MRHVYSEFYIDKKKYYLRYNTVSQEFYSSHNIGDTIFIKFLPWSPENSIIIEDKKYKTCYGIPPKNGWKKLPLCKH
jgi:hypothetical protein